MRIGRIEVKRRVGVGLLFALTASGVWWMWTRSMQPAVAVAAKGEPPFVRLASLGTSVGDQVLRERAEYFDPTPLFFPTEWNYGQGLLRGGIRREPDQVFGSFEANLPFADQYYKARNPGLTPAVERLADILGQGNERPLGGLGQVDRPLPPIDLRSGYMEISNLLDGRYVIKQSFADLSLPHSDYKPTEFIAVVGSAGMVSEPALVSGSGWEDVDNLLRTYLVKTFRLGERLGPGRYRVVVGP